MNCDFLNGTSHLEHTKRKINLELNDSAFRDMSWAYIQFYVRKRSLLRTFIIEHKKPASERMQNIIVRH